MGGHELDRLRRIAFALPEVSERFSHGAPCFFVAVRRPLCYFHDRHNDDRVSLWCPSPPGAAAGRLAAEPDRHFRPPTSARGAFAGWLGTYLDLTPPLVVDWEDIVDIVEDAYRCVAPRRLVALL
jgi:hypothetical protein